MNTRNVCGTTRWSCIVTIGALTGVLALGGERASLAMQDAASATATTAPPATAVAPVDGLLTAAELEVLVVPIALYPDALLAHVIPASTMPLDIVQAARFLRSSGGTVTEAPADAPWDASVKALLNFPTVLYKMDEDIGWTQQLGDAIILQQADVMDAVQRVRSQAYASGALASNEKQTVVVEQSIVEIKPADPTVVYVPTYTPNVVYVDNTPSVVYVDNSPDWVAGAVTFGAGVVVGALLADDHCDWHGHGFHHNDHWGYDYHGSHGSFDGNLNVNRNTNRNVDRNRDSNRDTTRDRRSERTGDRASRRDGSGRTGGGWSPSRRAQTGGQLRERGDAARRTSRGTMPATGRGSNNPGNARGRLQDRSGSGRTQDRGLADRSRGRETPSRGSAGDRSRGRETPSRGSARDRSSRSSRSDSPFANKKSGSNTRRDANRGNSSRSKAGQRSGGRSGGASRGSRSSGRSGGASRGSRSGGRSGGGGGRRR